MKFRIAILFVAAVTVASISVFAGSMNWSDEPVFSTSGEAGYQDQRIYYETCIWKDGSAELKLTPEVGLPENKLPAYGTITVNDKEYKMAVRKDSEGRHCLYGSVPVGTFSLDKTIVYSAMAYDYNDKRIFNDYAHNIVD